MAGQRSITTKASAAETVIRCPRCGYDQRGTFETWNDSWPLCGQCAECGLAIDWGRVLRMARHPWLFEYHWRHQPLRRIAQTIVRSMMPWRFWREVRLDDPFRPRPVLLLLLLIFVVAFIVASAGSVVVVMKKTMVANWSFGPGKSQLQWAWLLFKEVMRWLVRHEVNHLVGPMTMILSMPLAFGLIPMTLRGAKVRLGHIVRIGMFSTFAPMLLFVSHSALVHLADMLGFNEIAYWLTPGGWRWLGTWHATWFDDLVGGVIATVFMAGWVWCWWGCACDRYLRLVNPWRTAAVLTGIALLLAVNAQSWFTVAKIR